MRRFLFTVAVICALTVAGSGGDDKNQPETFVQDIEVTVRHIDGKVETFGKEVAELEIIVDESGRMHMVHMVLVSGTEKDTHLWLNYANLASLKYRFLHITGKGKVRVRQLQGFKTTANEKALRPNVGAVEVDDYK